MKIYLAGTSVSVPTEERKIQRLFCKGRKLHSFFHIQGFEHKWFMMNVKNKVELFLDSGAFSAWSKGASIDIQEYIEFIKQHEDVIEVYANLDVIGDAKATWKNQRIMERAGLHPLPIFHFGSPEHFLEKYVSAYNYIGLGGTVGIAAGGIDSYLDRIFSKYICDAKGVPKVKVHGFGLTSLRLMLRYPWYSVDSTSWVVAGRMGSIYMP